MSGIVPKATPDVSGEKGVTMFYFKACPRCQGDLYGDRDTYGSFIACLQCGYVKDSDAPGPQLAMSREMEEQEAQYARAD